MKKRQVKKVVKVLIMTKLTATLQVTTIRNNSSTIQIMEIKSKVEINIQVYNYDKLMLINIKNLTQLLFYSYVHF